MTTTEITRSIINGNLSAAELSQIVDAVKFYSHRAGYTVTGTVKKVAIKYVTVSTNQGLWRVPANMLEAA